MQAEGVVVVIGCGIVVIALFGIVAWGMYQDGRTTEKIKD